MSKVLVDSNVILDILTEDQTWFEWSSRQLADCAQQGGLLINPIIYAEISIGFQQRIEFAHILSTFPIVPDPTKQASLKAYRDVERGLIT